MKILFAKPEIRETPANLKKHSDFLSDSFSLPCIIYLENIDSQEKKRLIQNGTSFIVPGVVFFAPNLGIVLNERIREVEKQVIEKFTPLTQIIYLYLLNNRNRLTENSKVPITYNLISVNTGINIMSIKRAIDTFSSIRIVKQTKNGIIFLVSHADFIDMALPYLFNPVKNTFFVTSDDFSKYFKNKYNLIIAGVAALQNISYISNKRQICGNEQVFAFAKKELLSISDKIIMKRRYENSNIEIQSWIYPPNICGGNPEYLSLYLSLRNTADERLQGAVEDLLEGIKYDGRT